ncbi:MAG: NADH-quinone oxidoreductase subunit C [bacterium]
MSENEQEVQHAPWVSESDTAARKLAEKYGEQCTVEEERVDPTVTLDKAHWAEAAPFLKDELKFETCHMVTGIDRGPGEGRIEVVYTLYSRNRAEWLHVRIPLDRPEKGELPEVESAAEVWKAADWHERETYDLVGVRFTGHPDHRRILLPDDWDGHPLRKDYTFPLEYHGIPDVYRMPGSMLYEGPREAASEGGEA